MLCSRCGLIVIGRILSRLAWSLASDRITALTVPGMVDSGFYFSTWCCWWLLPTSITLHTLLSTFAGTYYHVTSIGRLCHDWHYHTTQVHVLATHLFGLFLLSVIKFMGSWSSSRTVLSCFVLRLRHTNTDMLCREACRSILTFFQDVLDLPTTFTGKHYRSAVDAVFLPRGATLTRVLLAALAGALPESRLSEVRTVLQPIG